MRCRIAAKYVDDEGVVRREQYTDGSLALTFTSLDGEPLSTLSINLSAYGLTPPPGCVFVKDYADGEGLAAGMVAAGIAVDVGTVTFGPYDTTATVMWIQIDDSNE